MDEIKDPALRKVVEAARRETRDAVDEETLRLVYRSMWRRRRRRWLWLLPAGAGLALAGVAAALLLAVRTPPPVAPRPESTPHPLSLEIVHQSRAPLATERRLADARSIRVPADSRLHLAADDRLLMVVLGPAHIRASTAHVAQVDDGRVQTYLRPASTREPVTIRAGDAVLEVLGTEFAFEAARGKFVGVVVSQGVVEVTTADGSQVRVEAGQRYPADTTLTPVEDDWRERPYWETAALTGALTVQSKPAGAALELDGVLVGETPLFVRWPAGTVTLRLVAEGYEPLIQTIDLRAGEEISPAFRLEQQRAQSPPLDKRADRWQQARKLLARKRCGKLASLTRELAAGAKSEERQAEAAALDAECALRTHQTKKALALFRSLQESYPATKTAINAAFEVGKLLADRGDNSGALRAFDDYLQRRPEGDLAVAATYRRCELLIRMRNQADARTCLVEYQHRFPSGWRFNESLLLLAAIERNRSRYEAAAALYSEYLTRDGGPSARHEKALFSLVVVTCRGRLTGAREAKERYLTTYPRGTYREQVEALCRR